MAQARPQENAAQGARTIRRAAAAVRKSVLVTLVSAGLAFTCLPLTATTLQQLSLNEMIQQSTGIVRARVVGSVAVFHGSNIYTHYRVQVLEMLKSSDLRTASKAIEVAVPGGRMSGVRQAVAGAPSLSLGNEYVLFLWTGPSGTTQLMGLSQGLFHVTEDAEGNLVLDRPATGELMLDRNGQPVQDRAVHLSMPDLRSQVGGQR